MKATVIAGVLALAFMVLGCNSKPTSTTHKTVALEPPSTERILAEGDTAALVAYPGNYVATNDQENLDREYICGRVLVVDHNHAYFVSNDRATFVLVERAAQPLEDATLSGSGVNGWATYYVRGVETARVAVEISSLGLCRVAVKREKWYDFEGVQDTVEFMLESPDCDRNGPSGGFSFPWKCEQKD